MQNNSLNQGYYKSAKEPPKSPMNKISTPLSKNGTTQDSTDQGGTFKNRTSRNDKVYNKKGVVKNASTIQEISHSSGHQNVNSFDEAIKQTVHEFGHQKLFNNTNFTPQMPRKGQQIGINRPSVGVTQLVNKIKKENMSPHNNYNHFGNISSNVNSQIMQESPHIQSRDISKKVTGSFR